MKLKWFLIVITLVMLFSPLSDTIVSITSVPIDDRNYQINPSFEEGVPNIPNLDKTPTHLKTIDVSETKARILFDEAHTTLYASFMAAGPISTMGGFLNTLGYETDVNQFNELTPTYLSDYDILAIFLPQSSFTTAEVQTILDFVNSGGSLIIAGTAYGYPEYHTSSTLNPITEPMNVSYNDVLGIDQYITSFLDHPLGTNITKLTLKKSTIFTVDSGANVQIVTNMSSGDPAFASRDYGNGKVFFSCTGDIFTNLRGPEILKGSEHFQFIANIFNWLADEPIHFVDEPEWMQIPLLDDYTTTETERRNYKMLLGTSHVHSDEGSSDSSTPVSNQIDYSRDAGLDFMILTDHQSDTPHLSWQPAADYLAANSITDLNIINGIEEDAAHLNHFHSFGMDTIQSPGSIHPANEWQGAYDTYKTEGAAIFQAHPLLSRLPSAITTINQYNYTYLPCMDGFEIVNAGFFGNDEGGIGEVALLYPFVSGSDAHSIWGINRSLMYVFVEENTDEAITEAILNRQVIIINYYQDVYSSGFWVDVCYQNMTIGDKQWLEEFSYRNNTAHSQYKIVSELIDNATIAGWEITEATSLLSKAEDAIRDMNYDRAMNYLEEIIASLYSIDTSTDTTGYDASEDIEVSLSVQDFFSNDVSYTGYVELLNWDNTMILDSESGLDLDTAILTIPSIIPSENYTINVQFKINGTLLTKVLTVQLFADELAPTVQFVDIDSGDIFDTSSFNLQWTGSDLGTGIDHYDLYINTELASTLTNTSYMLNLQEGDGLYSLEVLAFDLAGNNGTTDEITITVDSTAPSISITSPTTGSTTGPSISLTWTLSESGSGISSIEILLNGVLTKTFTDDSVLSYDLELSEGTHTITIQATDNAGNIDEDEITITVEIVTTTTDSETSFISWYLIIPILSGFMIWRRKRK